MDTLQAAILLEIFELFPEEVEKRNQIGEYYSSQLNKIDYLQIPVIGEGNTSVYAQYTILGKERKRIQMALKSADIPSVSYYSVPLHLQPVFNGLEQNVGDFPVTEKVATRCLSLPMSPYLTNEEQEKVIQAIKF